MLQPYVLALQQLFQPELRRPLWLTLAWTLALCAALAGATYYEIERLSVGLGAYGPVLQAAGAVAIALLLWFGFALIENTILFCYSDSIVRAVECRYYPALPMRGRLRPVDLAWSGIRLLLIDMLLNLAALPIYLLVPGANLVLFLAVNGYVLGRAYFDAVALRRLDDRSARRAWRAERWGFVLNGVISASLMTVPVVNLVAPIIGLAAAVHLFERRPATERAARDHG